MYASNQLSYKVPEVLRWSLEMEFLSYSGDSKPGPNHWLKAEYGEASELGFYFLLEVVW